MLQTMPHAKAPGLAGFYATGQGLSKHSDIFQSVSSTETETPNPVCGCVGVIYQGGINTSHIQSLTNAFCMGLRGCRQSDDGKFQCIVSQAFPILVEVLKSVMEARQKLRMMAEVFQASQGGLGEHWGQGSVTSPTFAPSHDRVNGGKGSDHSSSMAA